MTSPTWTNLRLAHDRRVVATARRELRRALAARSVAGAGAGAGAASAASPAWSELRDDAVLVLSELLTNAVLHARPLVDGQVVASWRVDGAVIGLRVTDGGGGTPVLCVGGDRQGAGRPGGRGLAIVQRLSEAWGVVEHEDGPRTVWAELALDPLEEAAPEALPGSSDDREMTGAVGALRLVPAGEHVGRPEQR